jgi:glutaredoxin
MTKKILYRLLFVALVLLIFDRGAAYFHRPNANSKDIVIYTTEWCPYCNSLRIHFDSNNIPYKEYDTEKSIAGITGFWALRARGVPVSIIGPTVVYGYDIDKINRSLVELGYNSTLLD